MIQYLFVVLSAWFTFFPLASASPSGLPTTNEELEDLTTRYYIELMVDNINNRPKPWILGNEMPKRPISQTQKKAFEKLKLRRQGRSVHIEIEDLKVELKVVNIFKNQYEINGMPWNYDPSAPLELQENLIEEILIRNLKKKNTTSAWLPIMLPEAHAVVPVAAGAIAVASRAIIYFGRPVGGFLKRWVWSWAGPIIKSNFAQGASGSALAMGALVPYLKCSSLGIDCPNLSDDDLKAKLASPEAVASLDEYLHFQSCANEQTPLVYEFMVEIDGKKFQVKRTLHFTKLANEDKSVPSQMTDDILTTPGRRSILQHPVSYDFEEGRLKRVRPTNNARDLVAIIDPAPPSSGGGSGDKGAASVDAVSQYIGEGYRNYDVQAATAVQRLCTIMAEMRTNRSGLQRDPAILDAIDSERKKRSNRAVD